MDTRKLNNLTVDATGKRKTLTEEIHWFEDEVAGKAKTPAACALLLASSALFADLRRHARKVAGRKESAALSARKQVGLDALRAALLVAGELAASDGADKSLTSQSSAPVKGDNLPVRESWVKPADCRCTGPNALNVSVMCQPCEDSQKAFYAARRAARK